MSGVANRCTITPSIPYCRIHWKCRSTVACLKELNTSTGFPATLQSSVANRSSGPHSDMSGQRSIRALPGRGVRSSFVQW
jgi:hypothetical protein